MDSDSDSGMQMDFLALDRESSVEVPLQYYLQPSHSVLVTQQRQKLPGAECLSIV